MSDYYNVIVNVHPLLYSNIYHFINRNVLKSDIEFKITIHSCI